MPVEATRGKNKREYLVVTEGVLSVECHGETYDIHRDQVFKFEQTSHMYIAITVRKKQAVPVSSWTIMENSDEIKKEKTS